MRYLLIVCVLKVVATQTIDLRRWPNGRWMVHKMRRKTMKMNDRKRRRECTKQIMSYWDEWGIIIHSFISISFSSFNFLSHHQVIVLIRTTNLVPVKVYETSSQLRKKQQWLRWIREVETFQEQICLPCTFGSSQKQTPE